MRSSTEHNAGAFAVTVGLAVAAVAMVATAAPLLVYTLSLAAFGLPHVLAELRYVDVRFRARLTRPLLVGLGALLGVLVIGRVAGLAGWDGAERAPVELMILAGLAAVTLPRLARHGIAPLLLGILVVALASFGCVTAPTVALVLLAVLHNLTPVGFLAERLRGTARRKALAACAVAFGLVPAMLMAGWPRLLLAQAGWISPDASLLPAGPLSAHLGSFVPAPWLDAAFATDLFVAAVYMQVLHYAVVIHVLPRLLDEANEAETTIRWPRGKVFPRLLAAVGAFTLVGFALSFGDARRAYGVFAAVHAWIEIPLLLLAVTPLTAITQPSPA